MKSLRSKPRPHRAVVKTRTCTDVPDTDDDKEGLSAFVCPDGMQYHTELPKDVKDEQTKMFGSKIAHTFTTKLILHVYWLGNRHSYWN